MLHRAASGARRRAHSDRPPAPALLAALVVAALGLGACGSSADEAEQIVDDAGRVVSSIGGDGIEESAAQLAEVLRANDLETVASAVEQVDLTAITDGQPFTVLAPSDQAFLTLDPDDVADLLADPEALEELVRNHVLTERLTAEDLAATDTITTASGNIRPIDDSGPALSIAGADVVEADIDADAGVIHVIDEVFLP